MTEAVYFQTEKEFRQWFDENYQKLGVKEIILSQEVCPDYVVKMEDGRILKIEAELFAVNFRYHRHDPSKADIILACYAKEQEVLGVPVMSINKLWLFEAEPIAHLPPEGPLSDDELKLLAAVLFRGGAEISSFAHKRFLGDKMLFKPISPEWVASIPRGRLEDNIFNVINDRTKKYIKKYHHILIGANLSEAMCEAIQKLRCRDLIRARPILIASALYDGVFIDHEGWVPTEIYATEIAISLYKKEAMKYLRKSLPTKRESSMDPKD